MADGCRPRAPHHGVSGHSWRSRPSRIALTGTPVENASTNCGRCWNSSTPEHWASASTFWHGSRSRSNLAGTSPPRTLRALTSRSSVQTHRIHWSPTRRTSAHLVDAPLTREQATLYQAIVEDAGAGQGRAQGRRPLRLTALKQVRIPGPLPGDARRCWGGRHRSGKLAALDEVLTGFSRPTRRCCVHPVPGVWELIPPMLERRAAGAVPFLHGGVTAAGRARWSVPEPRRPGGLLASLRAGGTGLTLTEANHVVPGPVVEPGGGEPGHGPRAPDRADAVTSPHVRRGDRRGGSTNSWRPVGAGDNYHWPVR